MAKEYILTTEQENERIREIIHLLLKTLAINNIPESLGMLAFGKAMLVIAQYNDFDDEDLRHLFTQLYKLYLEAMQKG